MALTALDIVVLILVGGAALLGVMRGFVTEILSLFAWVAAIVALKLLFTTVSHWLIGPVGTETGAAILAFVAIFGITFFGGRMVARSVGARTRQSVLGPLDRLLGLGFGALKGLLGATVLFLLVSLVYDSIWGSRSARPDWMRASHTYPLLHASGGAVVDWVAARRAGTGG
ncbi:CvpA family protein [Sphingomonas quercus]|uniref:CvpA family protein n=1 Tax=Sphingomonas quercus TaxID=2842451 RepID=A0ABS6BGK0_9SPHN|nr:CvpA family protein [Sphingomonas quercus]MBU3076375.1 CvpA family protein [Sphingomonas quercus]